MNIPIVDQLQYFCEDEKIDFNLSELKEIEKFLTQKNCEYVNNGSFSCVFRNEESVYIVCTKEDKSKELTISSATILGTDYLPEIERVYSFDNFIIYKEEILEIKGTFDVSEKEETLVNGLKEFRFCFAIEFLKTKSFYSLSYDLQEFFTNLAKMFQYEVQLDFSLANIGWRNNKPVFFDILLPA